MKTPAAQSIRKESRSHRWVVKKQNIGPISDKNVFFVFLSGDISEYIIHTLRHYEHVYCVCACLIAREFNTSECVFRGSMPSRTESTYYVHTWNEVDSRPWTQNGVPLCHFLNRLSLETTELARFDKDSELFFFSLSDEQNRWRSKSIHWKSKPIISRDEFSKKFCLTRSTFLGENKLPYRKIMSKNHRNHDDAYRFDGNNERLHLQSLCIQSNRRVDQLVCNCNRYAQRTIDDMNWIRFQYYPLTVGCHFRHFCHVHPDLQDCYKILYLFRKSPDDWVVITPATSCRYIVATKIWIKTSSIGEWKGTEVIHAFIRATRGITDHRSAPIKTVDRWMDILFGCTTIGNSISILIQ